MRIRFERVVISYPISFKENESKPCLFLSQKLQASPLCLFSAFKCSFKVCNAASVCLCMHEFTRFNSLVDSLCLCVSNDCVLMFSGGGRTDGGLSSAH